MEDYVIIQIIAVVQTKSYHGENYGNSIQMELGGWKNWGGEH
jgi:hypothetical protein